MLSEIYNSVIIIVNILIIPYSIIIYIVNLCGICRERVYKVNDSISVIISVSIVTNSIKVSIGIFIGIEGECILSIRSSVSIGIYILWVSLKSDFLTVAHPVIISVRIDWISPVKLFSAV